MHHYTKAFDLTKLESLWYVVEPFGPWAGAAHTFLSFGFAGHEYLSISVEVRKKKGQKYSALKGLFKQYQLMYVIGDEQDLIKLRTHFRRHPVYLYPIRANLKHMRILFLDMLQRANRLRDQPEFYHTVFNSCTTNIVRHINTFLPRKIQFNYKILFPGYSDRLAYDRGMIDSELSFTATQKRCEISKRAQRAKDHKNFSSMIRQVEKDDA